VEQRVSLVSLGVADVHRARAFYERLGWRGQEIAETVFFQAGGLVVVLWSRTALARDCGLLEEGAAAPGDGDDGSGEAWTPTRFDGIALAHNVRSPAEVDAVLAEAEAAGARVTRPAVATFYGGYAGVFTDPDGHAWEVAHNPTFPITEGGAIVLPDLGTS
jgi:catechol 2,3-dioxygenase-like lactoylglutathione lyase family enzyme